MLPKESKPTLQGRSLGLFLALAFGPAWGLLLLPLLLDPSLRPSGRLLAWSLAMWQPGIGAVSAVRAEGRRPVAALGLNRLGPRRFYLWAWGLPPLLTLSTGLLTIFLGAGRLDSSLPALRRALPSEAPVPTALLGTGLILFALTLAPLLNTPLALGEELGWRAFLLPRLLPLGPGRALILTGLLWGLWHAPAVAQGLNYPGQPLLGPLLMVGFASLLGVILGWLFLRTGSPWAPALAHGAVNATGGLPLLFLADVNPLVGGTLPSLIGWIPLGISVLGLGLSGELAAAARAFVSPAAPGAGEGAGPPS